jgi:transposase-like protein
MAKKKRRHNPNLLRLRHSYTISEVAEKYGVHRRTVGTWRKQGLQVIDESSKPFLVLGAEVRRFLQEKYRARKHLLKPGEFFCLKCRKPRRSLQNQIKVEITDKRLGRYRQAILRGVCEVCNCHLFLFTSDRRSQELIKTYMILKEHETTIIGSRDSSLNTDIERGENDES